MPELSSDTSNLIRAFENQLADPFEGDETPASSKIAFFAVTAIRLLWTLIKTIIIQEILPLIDDLHDQINDDSSSEEEETPAATTAQPTETTTRKQGKRPRCTKCHARGHTDTVCHTQNPSVTRKRVAENARRRKAARYIPAAPYLYPPPLPPPLPYPATTANYAQPHVAQQEYAALAVDAAELRRRAMQSQRDKRRAKRSQAS